jgi:secreted trypsin-like serine protease
MGVFIGGVPVGSCSCTLIADDVVLTAAHCIEYVQSLGAGVTVLVSFDEDPITYPASANWKSVSYLIPHPDYNWGPTSNPHDVGLLLLAQPVMDIVPATLPYEGFLNDLRAAGELGHGRNKAQLTVVGFGSTLNWPPPVIDFLPHSRQNAQSGFRSLLKAWLNLSQNQATGDSGTCFGDSGGPVFWEDSEEEDNETLVGITSWGDPNCISPSFNYRVDISDTLDFICLYVDCDGY